MVLALLLMGAALAGCGQSVAPQAAHAQAVAGPPAVTSGSTDPVTQPKPAAPAQATDGKASPSATDQPPPAAEPPDVPANPFPVRLDAPPLSGGEAWINTSGPLELQQLRGKFVLLDFWTYCCINCMHVLPELKKLEHAYPNELVVIGVHSAKFDGESNTNNIREAVLRYEIEHPVVNDAQMAIWRRYGVNSWPTMVLIDPEGKAVYMRGGEFTFEQVDRLLQASLPHYRAIGALDETPVRFVLESSRSEPTPLRFPGKVLADAAGDRLFIADSNHNRIVVTRRDGTLLHVIGSGIIGKADGDYQTAQFNKPQGMVLRGETLYVADTENHLLRAVDLKARQVSTIAGVGRQGRNPWPGLEQALDRGGAPPERWVGKPLETEINSPWDLWIHGDDLHIAMAGPHQIWKMPLDGREIGPYAGNGREDIVDGKLLPAEPYDDRGYSSFAQPSGLSSDGTWLYVADSEGSSIRAVPFDPDAKVRTVVGTAHLSGGRLFEFGDKDGLPPAVLFQHCLGVVYLEGKLYVADTYNNKIRVVDPTSGETRTLVGAHEPGRTDDPPRFDEPGGLSAADGKLYVADTNNHLIRVVDLKQANRVATLEIPGLTPPERTTEPSMTEELLETEPTAAAAVRLQARDGAATLRVELPAPDGFKLNPLAPLRYRLLVEGAEGVVDRDRAIKPGTAKPGTVRLDVVIPLRADQGRDTVTVVVDYYICQEGQEGVCRPTQAAWRVPLEIDPAGSSEPALIRAAVP